jgi:hypothetical protein
VYSWSPNDREEAETPFYLDLWSLRKRVRVSITLSCRRSAKERVPHQENQSPAKLSRHTLEIVSGFDNKRCGRGVFALRKVIDMHRRITSNCGAKCVCLSPPWIWAMPWVEVAQMSPLRPGTVEHYCRGFCAAIEAFEPAYPQESSMRSCHRPVIDSPSACVP